MSTIPTDVSAELRALLARCAAEFERWSGRRAEVVAAAPGRVNLIGEHTDYNDGFVLPMAIDRWCVAAGARAEGARGRVRAIDLDEEVLYEAGGGTAESLTKWARYPVGTLWTIGAARGTPLPGVEMAMSSTVPMGAGLSSSAAVELATGALANEVLGLQMPGVKLAEAGRAAEHTYAGVPCGIMDQAISACGEEGSALLIDCRSMAMRAVRLPAGAAVVVADSGVRRSLAEGAYAARRAACERGAAAMGVRVLRDANAGMLERAMSVDEEARRCARHVIGENARVERFVAASERGDAAGCGKLMAASHESLRDDFRVSCAELDEMVRAAMGVEGVWGSRMTGAGFGGCTVTLCKADAAATVVGTLEAVTRVRGGLVPFVARAVGGARAWRA
jgi:galactokinase